MIYNLFWYTIKLDIEKNDVKLFLYATTGVRIILVQVWKQQQIPTMEEGRQKMVEYTGISKLTSKLDSKVTKYMKGNGGKFLMYMDKMYGIWEY